MFLAHGYPFNSEKYYDVSGSATHLILILYSLIKNEVRNDRQIMNSFLAVMWLTRLGTFLFTRIMKDQVDSRFHLIKKNPLRFLSVWTI